VIASIPTVNDSNINTAKVTTSSHKCIEGKYATSDIDTVRRTEEGMHVNYTDLSAVEFTRILRL